jgi:hypothetical protein
VGMALNKFIKNKIETQNPGVLVLPRYLVL